jgi:hypothetical protein
MSPSGTGLTLAVLPHGQDERTLVRALTPTEAAPLRNGSSTAMQQSAEEGIDDEALHAVRTVVPWVAVSVPVWRISAVIPVPSALVSLPLLVLPRLAMAVSVAGLPALPEEEEELGDFLEHSRSHLRWSCGQPWTGVTPGRKAIVARPSGVPCVAS